MVIDFLDGNYHVNQGKDLPVCAELYQELFIISENQGTHDNAIYGMLKIQI